MKKFLLSTLIIAFAILNVMAQENKADKSAAQANNPLANMTAFSLQNYYSSKLTDSPADAYSNTTFLYIAKPMINGKVFFRASIPVGTVGTPDYSATENITATNGLRDISALFPIVFHQTATTTIGVGPLVVAPTATDDVLGQGKWQTGLALLTFVAKSPLFQWGGLITWQISFAGDDDRSSVNAGALQPFLFWQLGQGTYLRSAPIWTADFENETYNIPMSLGVGKVMKKGNTVFNFYIEPQYSMLNKGTQPQVQLLAGINMQIIGKAK